MLGEIGAATYGPMTLTAHYHFNAAGRLQPYVGAGIAAMLVFGERDGLLTRLNLDPAVGITLQAGVDYMVNEKWGVFADVKKAFLKTEASGYLGDTKVEADVQMDPLVIQAGLTFRF